MNWNGHADTRACLESLLAQHDLTAPVQILVVDNGSDDDSLLRLQQEFGTQIHFLAAPRNLGFAGGSNLGIRHALAHGAALVLLLNNDTAAAPDFLSALLETARRNPGAAIFGCRILYWEPAGRLWYAGGDLCLWLGRARHRGFRRADTVAYHQEREVGFVTGCAMVVRAEAFHRLGLLDESLFLYFEDVDFCQRARRVGYRMRYVPQAVLRHRVGAGAGRKLAPRYLYYQTRNRYIVLRRGRGPGYRFWLLCLHVTVYMALRMFVLALTGGAGRWRKVSAVWQGGREALRRRPGPQVPGYGDA